MPRPEILSRPSADKLKFIERIKDGKPGDFISYKELSDLVVDNVQEGRAYQTLRNARNYAIREFSIVWHPTADHTGLKCLTPEEITQLGEKDRQKIARAAGRGLRRLRTVDYSKMNQVQMLKHVAMITHMKVIQLTASRKKREKLEQASADIIRPLDSKAAFKLLADSAPKKVSGM
jgi:hypothetical protein